jgi:hemoglobin
MKQDILTFEDVKLLVDTFYEKVKVNPLLGYIFNDVAKVDWSHHLPKMYSFWSAIILGDQSYEGNPMLTHIRLSKLTPLTDKEFTEWLLLFNSTVDELFDGVNALEAKARAANIARLMQFKVQGLESGKI